MTQPYQYDPSQQQQPEQQPSAPFDPAQHPQTPAFQQGQAASAPFGPTSDPSAFPPQTPNFLPPRPPKKSKTGLFIVLGVVVLLLIGGGIGVAIWRPWAAEAEVEDNADASDDKKDDKDDGSKDGDSKDGKENDDEGVPAQVVDDAWHAKDWSEAKSYMCEELATKLEADGAAEKYRPIGDDEEYKATDETIEGDNATVSIETTVAGSEGSTNVGKIDVKLIKEESDWKICEIGEPK